MSPPHKDNVIITQIPYLFKYMRQNYKKMLQNYVAISLMVCYNKNKKRKERKNETL